MRHFYGMNFLTLNQHIYKYMKSIFVCFAMWEDLKSKVLYLDGCYDMSILGFCFL